MSPADSAPFPISPEIVPPLNIEESTDEAVLPPWLEAVSHNINLLYSCADPESFVRGGPILMGFFLVCKGRDDLNTTISGPSSPCQQNAINWRFACVPIMAQYLMLAW